MEIFDEDVEYLRYVKVALATAIIRQKPHSLTAKQYTEQLAAIVREKDEESHKKVHELQTELFQTKQKLFQAQLVSRNDVSLDKNAACTDTDMDNILLTPTPSSEDSKTERIETSYLVKHAQFLRSVSFLCTEPLDISSVFAGDEVTVIKETLVKIIGTLTQDSGSKMVLLPQPVLLSCINGILEISLHLLIRLNKDILDCSSLKNYHSDLKVPVLTLVEHLITMITKANEDALQEKKIDKISHLVVIFGCISCLRNETLAKLTSSVLEVSSKLRDVTQGRCLIKTVLSEYHSVYYVLWSIERILTKTLSQWPCPETVKNHLTMILEESVLHISRSFPVFASYVWRIQALVC